MFYRRASSQLVGGNIASKVAGMVAELKDWRLAGVGPGLMHNTARSRASCRGGVEGEARACRKPGLSKAVRRIIGRKLALGVRTRHPHIEMSLLFLVFAAVAFPVLALFAAEP